MSGSAIVMAVIGVLVIWGGLAASLMHAAKKSKSS
ncbi:methionine/alanine import family NSS transporter small subunit [Bacillus carboniphilus]